MKILFSIPVHEKEDCVLDMIFNIIKYVEKPIIVLHVAKGFKFQLPDSLNNVVFINPEQLYTGMFDGSLFYAHCSNLEHSRKLKIKFDKVLPFGSNQLFIKEGIEIFLNSNDYYSCSNESRVNTHSKYYYRVSRDNYYRDILNIKADIYKSAPEGTFYNYSDLICHIDSMYESDDYLSIVRKYYKSELGLRLRKVYCNITKIFYRFKIDYLLPKKILRFTYPLEEFVFPSWVKHNESEYNRICFMNWKNNLDVRISDVKYLRSNDNSIFTVKRVERDIDDSVRKYIRDLT